MSGAASALRAAEGDLLTGREFLISDLDGVVVLGTDPIDHASEAFARVRDRGITLRFVTNNASRPPQAVAETLRGIGVEAVPDEVVTSATAGARILSERYPAGSAVLMVGGDGVRFALEAVGLRPVDHAAERPVAVLQGFAPEVGWQMLAEAMIAIRDGAAWMATNLDRTLPSPRGPLPGNGSLVAALATASGVAPESVGKPAPTLYDEALAGRSAGSALAIGDRLDTDIEGAVAAGVDSLLVLTGVTGAAGLIRAASARRPTFVGRDLRTLFTEHPDASCSQGEASCRQARARIDHGAVRIDDGGSGPDGLDGLRALCALAWATDTPDPESAPEMYDAAVRELGLD